MIVIDSYGGQNMSDKKINLFDALWECLEELRLVILEKIEAKGKKGYQTILKRDIVTLWEAYFCPQMVEISIAPNKREDVNRPNRNALGQWKNGNINNQIEKTILTNYIPQLSGNLGHIIIDAQRDHIIGLVEMSERYKKSEKTTDSNGDKYLLEEELKSRDSLVTFIYQRFNQLKESFEDRPLQLMEENYQWFQTIVEDRIPDINSDETEKVFASIFSAALIMALNIHDNRGEETRKIPEESTKKVEENIASYLRSLIGVTDSSEPKEESESEYVDSKKTKDKNYNEAKSPGLKKRISVEEAAYIVEKKMEEFEQIDFDYTDTSIIDTIVSYRHYIDDSQFEKVRDFFLRYIKEIEKVGQIDSAKWIHCVIALTLLGLRIAEQRIDALKENLDNERYADQRNRILQKIHEYERRIFEKELDVDDMRMRLYEKEHEAGMQF